MFKVRPKGKGVKMGLEKIRTPLQAVVQVRFRCAACFTDQTATIDPRWDVVNVEEGVLLCLTCEVPECRTAHELVLGGE